MAQTGNLTRSNACSFFKGFLSLLIVCGVLAFVYAPSQTAWAKPNPKYGSIVIDADTGAVISQDRADKKLHPASLTKIMTLLMVFEALETGKISLNDKIKISKHAASMPPSKFGLMPGSTIKVKDAIYALVTKSANDIAAAVAEHLGGTEYGFARMMTIRAHELGMRSTNFVNASGLHNERQISTPRDMAQLARFVILQYPEYYRYFSTTNFSYQGKSYHNHNRLMSSYKGMDGMKTGYVGASGFNLVASAVRNNRRIIGVVFGGYTSRSRNDHMAKLLDKAWGQKGDIRLASALPQARGIAPIPPRKPGITSLIAQLDGVLPAGGENIAAGTLKASDTQMPEQRTASYAKRPSFEEGFDRLIGEGDFDPALYKRIETGLIAVSAVKNAHGNIPPQDLHRTLNTAAQQSASTTGAPLLKKVSLQPKAKINPGQPWSVQIGAFKSRAATDRAIQSALKSLPTPYSQGQPLIAPLKAGSSWLFRARLSGYTQEEAMATCKILPDCLPVAPVQ